MEVTSIPLLFREIIKLLEPLRKSLSLFHYSSTNLNSTVRNHVKQRWTSQVALNPFRSAANLAKEHVNQKELISYGCKCKIVNDFPEIEGLAE